MAIITGDDTDNTLSGTAGNDTISGLGGDDTLSGAAGNDILEGGAGSDTLIGGAGIDTVSYAGNLTGVSVFMGPDGGAIDDDFDDFGADIENAWGSNFADGMFASDTGNELRGLGGDDELWGGDGNDTLDGGDGDDFFFSLKGADILKGGAGNDTVSYNLQNTGGTPGVTVSIGGIGQGGDAEGDTIGADIENLEGTSSADALTGSAADNLLSGFEGADRLVGGAGDDVLRGGIGADRLDGGADHDMADYSFSRAQVRINLFAGTAIGGDAQGDVLTDIEGVRGGAGNDLLIGGSRGNTLDGAAGNDVIRGDGQHDILIGGSGADRFVYDDVGDSPANANADEIRDFSHAQGDRIDLRLVDADVATAGDQAFSFIGVAAFSGHAGELRAVVSGGLTTITADVDGNGTAELRIFLSGSLALVAADFQL